MKNTILILVLSFYAFTFAQTAKSPVVETYSASSRVRSGIAMGGIGTGSIELRKDGNFYNWSIFNNSPRGTGPIFELPTKPKTFEDQSFLFFLVRYQVEGEKPQLKLLQLNNSLQEGAQEGIIYYYPWMSAVDKIEYSARFPFTNMKFTDAEMPFDIELEAFSPFIPFDVKNSALPGVYFNFNVKSKSNKNVDVMLLGSMRNLVGYDTHNKAFEATLVNEKGYTFFAQTASGMDEKTSTYGQMGLGVIGGDEISYYLGWEHKHPYYEKLLVENKLANIDDTHSRNSVSKEGKKIANGRNDQRCFSSIAVSRKLKSGDQFASTFFMNWNFPNNFGGVENHDAKDTTKCIDVRKQIGVKQTKNKGLYYQNYFADINATSKYFATQAATLSARSHQFVNDMYSSDIDQFVLDQVNSHLNTFVSSSTLTKQGEFGIREGLTPAVSWGPNVTSDVSLYGSPMIIGLFPELQKASMRSHAKLQTKEGEINHGLGYDMDFNQNGTWGVYDRVDLVPNYIQMVLRDFLWTNDKNYIKEMWPTVKLGINYMLTKRDKDGDQMPDMNGIMCSYDNFPMYGLASYIQSQWINALTMAAEVAGEMGEPKLQKQYTEIAQKGSKLMEQKLWNGSYYNLSNDYLGKKGVDNGCLTDQLIGQWVAHNAGLGYIFDKANVQKSLKSIMEKSFMSNSFLRNCSWPAHPELFPIETSDLWVDQANTPWTGVELAFASFLIYEDMLEDGLKVIKGVDDRYRKAGLYFDHQEFGGHYYRPMAAWSIMTAYLGYSVNLGTYSFNPKIKKPVFSMFFTTPSGTAIYKKELNAVSIEVKTGELTFTKLEFKNSGIENKKPSLFVGKDKIKDAKIKFIDGKYLVTLSKEYIAKTGTSIFLK